MWRTPAHLLACSTLRFPNGRKYSWLAFWSKMLGRHVLPSKRTRDWETPTDEKDNRYQSFVRFSALKRSTSSRWLLMLKCQRILECTNRFQINPCQIVKPCNEKVTMIDYLCEESLCTLIWKVHWNERKWRLPGRQEISRHHMENWFGTRAE